MGIGLLVSRLAERFPHGVPVALVLLPILAALGSPCRAQFPGDSVELSSSVALDEVDGSVRAHLERVAACVADRQWDDAVEILREVLEGDSGKMIALAPGRYVSLADYCQAQLAALPEDALALYRERVDDLARAWYEEGLTRRDPERLAQVVQKLFCSSWADDALFALGELQLEKAHYQAARLAWSRLIELPATRVPAERFKHAREHGQLAKPAADLLEHWYQGDGAAPAYYYLRQDEFLGDADALALVRIWKDERLPPSRLAYPGSSISAADVRARLVLVSILEGSVERGEAELSAFERHHPEAEGRLAGRKVKYAEALSALIQSAEKWPGTSRPDEWHTFAGSPERTAIAARRLDIGPPAWEPITLGEPLSADISNSRVYSLRRIGEDAQRLLSYHPLVVGDVILINDQNRIYAFSVKTGAPAWPRNDPKARPGEIYRDDTPVPTGRTNGRLGVPRFTMTAEAGRLYARMGSQVTSRPLELLDGRAGGYLVCLDLNAMGHVVWKLALDEVDDEKWAFEGSPLADGRDLYVAMRKSDVRPQSHVACFDAETKRLRWRTKICAAETPAGGQAEEMTHNLLTLAEGTLYFNTNLGAVAAVRCRDGHLEWATLYRRAKKAQPDGQDRRAAHFYRDLNPCVYDRGRLFIAPADCESILSLDAGTGELLWETQLPEDVVHLLGVGGGNLLASGDVLWWIDAARGKVIKRWPDTSPLGHGRGILMGDQVVWPTASELYTFDQQPAPRERPRDAVRLSERGVAGGNVVAGGGLLLIATADKLFALKQQGREPPAKVESPEPKDPAR